MRKRLLAGVVTACTLIAVSALVALVAPPYGKPPLTFRTHFGVIHGSVDTNGPDTLVMRGGWSRNGGSSAHSTAYDS